MAGQSDIGPIDNRFEPPKIRHKYSPISPSMTRIGPKKKTINTAVVANPGTAAIFSRRPGVPRRAPYLCVAAHGIVRTVFLVQMGQPGPRPSIEPFALMQCAVVLALAWTQLTRLAKINQ
ncbi:MAG: hypothetical protein HOB79_20330 [Rhodospirillaceae bacterium]|jgi:hypothetical protein|nr:hypothetical protein [Rhodospirillaceae bacterium]